MSRKPDPIVAFIYDFDGTLSPRNMQDYHFIPSVETDPQTFWEQSNAEAARHNADRILAYMRKMLDAAKSSGTPSNKRAIEDSGKKIKLCKGLRTWFRRTNRYARTRGFRPYHFIISSGLREMIEGCRIAKEFKKIYASSFWYDENGVPAWPATAINYTTKTQYLFRINKWVLEERNDKKVNRFTEREKRPVPFSRMIFIGDGDSDVPCMRLVREKGGLSIAVYPPNRSRKKARELIDQERVDFVSPADYRSTSALSRIVEARLDLLQAGQVYERLLSTKQRANG